VPPPLEVKQVTGDERHKEDVRMQVAPGGVQQQPGERLNQQQRQEKEVASESANSRPLRTRQVSPRRPRATALVLG
jgi:hypothetical protein